MGSFLTILTDFSQNLVSCLKFHSFSNGLLSDFQQAFAKFGLGFKANFFDWRQSFYGDSHWTLGEVWRER
jgi:hypothetical protein